MEFEDEIETDYACYSVGCETCDSFTVDGECVSPSLTAAKEVLVSSGSRVVVTFNSYHPHGERQGKAQLLLTGE